MNMILMVYLNSIFKYYEYINKLVKRVYNKKFLNHLGRVKK